ncbi:MAG: hypothetical protein JWN44_1980 [Myxococcales bacterium]|nr:hypothetical protein [Myxococcales bacterium]
MAVYIALPIRAAIVRYASILLAAGVLSGCATREPTNGQGSVAGNGVDISDIAPSNNDEAAPATTTHPVRLRVTHRVARHRHAGPR